MQQQLPPALAAVAAKQAPPPGIPGLPPHLQPFASGAAGAGAPHVTKLAVGPPLVAPQQPQLIVVSVTFSIIVAMTMPLLSLCYARTTVVAVVD
jgi:hypothetical protein